VSHRRPLKVLHGDPLAKIAVGYAARRDEKFGSGDSHDFGLFCYEEGRAETASGLKRAAKALEKLTLHAAALEDVVRRLLELIPSDTYDDGKVFDCRSCRRTGVGVPAMPHAANCPRKQALEDADRLLNKYH
jgi:hypothetical protein